MSHEQQQPVTFPPLVVATDPVAANRATRAPSISAGFATPVETIVDAARAFTGGRLALR